MTIDEQQEKRRAELRGKYIQQQIVDTFRVRDPSAWLKEQSTANGPEHFWDSTLQRVLPEDWIFAWEHAPRLLEECGRRMDPESVSEAFRKLLPLLLAANVPVYQSGEEHLLIQLQQDVLSMKVGKENALIVSALNSFPTREWTESVLRSLLLCWRYSEPERANLARGKLCGYVRGCVGVFEKEAFDRFEDATFVVDMNDRIYPFRPESIVSFDDEGPPKILADPNRRVRQSYRALTP
jgi:hypothetical protein